MLIFEEKCATIRRDVFVFVLIELMFEKEDIQFDLSFFLIELNVNNDENKFLNINRVIN